MAPSIGTVTNDIRRLLMEEAHLVGQELQDSLGHDELHRLRELSTALDEVDELFLRRRPVRSRR